MNKFINVINIKKFKLIEELWNKLNLSNTWVIGNVMYLINSRNFESREEWKEFYLKSGEKRLKELINFNEDVQMKLKNFKIVDNELSNFTTNLNVYHGRTEEELKEIGKYLHEQMKLNNHLNISLPECIYVVKFKVIGEFWNNKKDMEISNSDLEFVNSIDKKKFQFTNKIWNDLGLNSRWSIGSISHLITSQHFKDKNEWRNFYYSSGRKRFEKMEFLKDDVKLKLCDFKKADYGLYKSYVNLNIFYGRTEDELKQIAQCLYDSLKENNPLNITLKECIYIVKFRVIGESWNGIIRREKNTVLNLQSRFPNLIFKKTAGNFDCNYEVDYQAYINDVLIAGIQIKPPTYKSNKNQAVLDVKKINQEKANNYFKDFNTSVIYIYSDFKGHIEDIKIA